MLIKIRSLVAAHFEAHTSRSKGRFFCRVSLESFLLKIGMVLFLGLLFDLPPRTDLDDFTVFQFLILAMAVAPFFETLFCQALPVAIARDFKIGFWGQVTATIPVFAILHFPSGVGTVICAGVVGGFYLGFTYVRWRQESFRCAFWMTAAMHAFANFLLIAFILLHLAVFPGNVLAPSERPSPSNDPLNGEMTETFRGSD